MTDQAKDPLSGEPLAEPTTSKEAVDKMTKPDSKPLSAEELADKDFLRKMCTEELAAIVRKNNGDIKGVPAINALWDRIDGKPPQAIHQTVDTTINLIDRREVARQEMREIMQLAREKALIDVTPNGKSVA